jgi:hypothetical protein
MKANNFDMFKPLPTYVTDPDTKTVRQARNDYNNRGGSCKVSSSTKPTNKYTNAEIDHLRSCIQKYGMDYSKESFAAMMEKERGKNGQ